jgi:thioredoxin reductase (NADPH)
MTEHKDEYDVIIIGGGPGGYSAAIYTARSGLSTLVIDKNPAAGALGMTDKIENYPGVAETLTGEELLKIFQTQASGFGAEVIQDKVIGATLGAEDKEVFINNGPIKAKAVIIATGSMGRNPSIKGEIEYTGRGVSYCVTCDAAFYKDKEVAMVGSVDEIMHELPIISRFAKTVHVIPNKPVEIKKEARLKGEPKVKLWTDTKVKEIHGEGIVQSLTIDNKEKKELSLPVSGAFLFLQGNKPVTDFLYGALKTSEKGCLVVNRMDMSTTVAGVYAVGDVVCSKQRQVVLAAADGCRAALAADQYINNRKQAKVQWG